MSDDAQVIPFPTRTVENVTAHVEEEPLWTPEDAEGTYSTLVAEADAALVGDTEPEPDVFVEATGEWRWIEYGVPEDAPAVGMVAYDVDLRCRWAHRHRAEGESMPQPCCHSVLVTTKRLPEVRPNGHWLAEEQP
jgi:hypothetical protein